jgi:hypothetical protein
MKWVMRLGIFVSAFCVYCNEEHGSYIHAVAENISSSMAVSGSWQGVGRHRTYRLQLDDNARFSKSYLTCFGCYLSFGTWTKNGNTIILEGDSGNAPSFNIQPRVWNTDANIFSDSTIEYFRRREFEIRNDTLYAADTLERYIKYVHQKESVR